MTERCARALCAGLLLAAIGCGASEREQRERRELLELRHEVIEVRQYNADLKFRMQLVEARNKVLTDLVQGLTADPANFQPKQGGGADAALAALDRDIEALVRSVRHSHADAAALRAQRAALEAELAEARQTIERARAAEQQVDARLSATRQLLAPMLRPIHDGRINVTVQYGQLTLQVPEQALFASGDGQLTSEGKALLERVAEGLRTANDRQFRIAGPADDTSQRGATARQLTAARTLAVLEYLASKQVPSASLVAATYARKGAAGERHFEVALLPKFEEQPKWPTPGELLEPAPAAQGR